MVGNSSTVMPSAVEAASAVPRREESEVCTTPAVVETGTIMVAVMRTLAAATRIVTSDLSTPAVSAIFCCNLDLSLSKKSLTLPLAVSVSTTVPTEGGNGAGLGESSGGGLGESGGEGEGGGGLGGGSGVSGNGGGGLGGGSGVSGDGGGGLGGGSGVSAGLSGVCPATSVQSISKRRSGLWAIVSVPASPSAFAEMEKSL